MVVVASLIGAKGLGEDVLEALQYASAGQGILAGFAILISAMMLNGIVLGCRIQFQNFSFHANSATCGKSWPVAGHASWQKQWGLAVELSASSTEQGSYGFWLMSC